MPVTFVRTARKVNLAFFIYAWQFVAHPKGFIITATLKKDTKSTAGSWDWMNGQFFSVDPSPLSMRINYSEHLTGFLKGIRLQKKKEKAKRTSYVLFWACTDCVTWLANNVGSMDGQETLSMLPPLNYPRLDHPVASV